MDSTRIESWADLLVDYCLRAERGETVAISGELPAGSLIEACYRRLVDRGAHPLARVELPGLAEYFLEHASESQLEHVSPIALHEAEHCEARIRIAAESDLHALARVDPGRQATVDRARAAIRKAAAKKRWVLTQFPTRAYADEAGMELAAYEEFAARSMFLDTPDPAESWRELGRRQRAMVEYLSTVSVIRIEGPGTSLELDVKGRVWINSDGRRNMPSGEVFTGPIESSAQGTLHCSFPVCRGGRRIEGIRLRFDRGRVVEASAVEGEAYLHSMLDLDPGARFLGELGIGLNYGIDRFTGSILYDEKIGGTIHVALGQSYPETGGTNVSALHWDLIVDLRRAGRVTADGRCMMENGVWKVG